MSSATGLVDFIERSPSPFHCVAEAQSRLSAAGFVPWELGCAPPILKPGARGFVARGGALVAWRAGHDAIAEAGFRLLGAHTDSPNLRIKPQPAIHKEGYLQWAVEPYGGVLLATWGDRDLGLAGRVAYRDASGAVATALVRDDAPLCRVANLAIHLNRSVNDKGLILNKQKHLPPIVAMDALAGGADTGAQEETFGALERRVAAQLGIDPGALISWDLCLFDVQKPTLGGIEEEFVFAPRLDNQASCYQALSALLALDTVPAHTSVVALFDHEEVGSGSERGADSSFLRNLLVTLERSHVETARGGFERAAANSFMVSADMAHGVHPNYADQHDAQHKPMLNGGPVVKHNVNMRYATDAVTAARFKEACVAEGVPVQEFVNRSDLACGSTIGPISASQLAIASVDVGGAMLSMHSIREMCGAHDVDMMTRVMARLLREG